MSRRLPDRSLSCCDRKSRAFPDSSVLCLVQLAGSSSRSPGAAARIDRSHSSLQLEMAAHIPIHIPNGATQLLLPGTPTTLSRLRKPLTVVTKVPSYDPSTG